MTNEGSGEWERMGVTIMGVATIRERRYRLSCAVDAEPCRTGCRQTLDGFDIPEG